MKKIKTKIQRVIINKIMTKKMINKNKYNTELGEQIIKQNKVE